jgi:hypothetical protein
MNDLLARMTGAVETLGEKMTQRVAEINQGYAMDKSSRVRYLKRIANTAASDMQDYCAQMEADVPLFGGLFRRGTSAMARAAAMAVEFGTDGKAGIEQAIAPLKSLKESLRVSRSLIVSFRDTVKSSPPMTAVYIAARNRTVTVLNDLDGVYLSVMQYAEDLEKSMLDLLGAS